MQRVLLVLMLIVSFQLHAQNLPGKIGAAINQMELEPKFKHASISLYIEDLKTGQVIYKKNEQLGLAPASCQKIITSVSAFELLGNNFQYSTSLSFDGKIENSVLYGNLLQKGSGDPTLGSWRYASTKEDVVLNKFATALASKNIKTINGNFIHNQEAWKQSTPDGWIWQDIGNYYGAGAYALNWRENQYDLILKSGEKLGDAVSVVTTRPKLEGFNFVNEVSSAAKGTGDNAHIYLPVGNNKIYVRGTIPLGENNFSISGSVPDPGNQLATRLSTVMNLKLLIKPGVSPNPGQLLYEHKSPTLDSINYWFLKKSVNLYGEAFVKTIAFVKTGEASTDAGIDQVKNFWKKQGLDITGINIIDGSGLSPANRVTTYSLVTILSFAKKRPWYNSFYNALPEINGIRMKSGNIGGAKSYSGYVKSKDGNEYVFSFIINNFDGSASPVNEKMFKILDLLK